MRKVCRWSACSPCAGLDVYHHVDRSKLHLLVISPATRSGHYEGMFFRQHDHRQVSHLDVLVIRAGPGA